MKITDVRTTVLVTRSIIVQVFTNEGLVGLGECSPMHATIVSTFVDAVLKPRVLGLDPRCVDEVWSSMFYAPYKLGVQGVHLEAMSGIDIACWDILGKAVGMPIWQLLGGRYRERVTMYKSIGGGMGLTPAEMAAKVEQALTEGFRAVKIRMDWGPARQDADPAKDLAMFRACKKVTGDDVLLSFDPNNGYSVSTAIRQGRRFEELGIYHYEEPVAQYDYAGIAQVADALDVPVSAGEHEYTRWQFRDLITQAKVDIIQPDIVKSGGITETRRIAVLGDTYNKPFVPHQTQPTIGTAANLHLIAALVNANRPQEYTGANPRLDALFRNPLRFADGQITVPTGPGLGLELVDGALERLRSAE
jgi:L-alanine-DL-glutamate epimerase-like enolase superfamily enzyme